MNHEEKDEDDPHDDVTHWAGQVPEASDDSSKRTSKRRTRRRQQPDVQRTEPPMEEGR